MHDPAHEGTPAFFICDFCRSHWSEDRPMVEGHKGSLICAKCLSVAYRALALDGAASIIPGPDRDHPWGGKTCTLCLEERNQPGWASPMHEDTIACLRCVKQSATTLEKDAESGWKRPA